MRVMFGATSVLAAALCVAAAANAEQTITRAHVPRAVLAAFAKQWPNAKVRGYSREVEKGETTYEVESREGDVKRDVSFAADGSVSVVEETMPASALPAGAQSVLAGLKPAAKVGAVEKVTRGATVEYEVHVRQGAKAKEIVFDLEGKRTK
ncbi:MAG: hypothetical protein HY076_05795 [Candidatus Eisenbacteria bacterium]|uniref:Putative beta-lactamase-inhibitor-like PepSY-like domain-containing protein n=1 Tax=Eiseniibacteriota bacterium TaxID=2212470 RepID=A0A9D6QK25_UNCEI|nr:hypothetical protein [Candidatus Eisenbacteria bacterium]MBI3539766.1 hypothetical protein [Candidatus Eisenbacteria bacterium]